MSRNTNARGGGFSDAEKLAVWNKGKVAAGFSPNDWRHDALGNLIKFIDYGNVNSTYGWEIDHIKPLAKGGTDQISNLQPLQWNANREKGDTWPWP